MKGMDIFEAFVERVRSLSLDRVQGLKVIISFGFRVSELGG